MIYMTGLRRCAAPWPRKFSGSCRLIHEYKTRILGKALRAPKRLELHCLRSCLPPLAFLIALGMRWFGS